MGVAESEDGGAGEPCVDGSMAARSVVGDTNPLVGIACPYVLRDLVALAYVLGEPAGSGAMASVVQGVTAVVGDGEDVDDAEAPSSSSVASGAVGCGGEVVGGGGAGAAEGAQDDGGGVNGVLACTAMWHVGRQTKPSVPIAQLLDKDGGGESGDLAGWRAGISEANAAMAVKSTGGRG